MSTASNRKLSAVAPGPKRKEGIDEDMDHELPSIFKAAATNDVQGIDLALAQGIDVNATDEDGLTPLHYASVNLADAAVDRLLKELNARNPLLPTKPDRFGRTASSIALEVRGEAGIEMARKLRPYCYPTGHAPG